jgi:hypothetical protein
MTDREGGAALILALVTAGLLAALGVSALVTTDVERQVAANAGFSAQALAAAEGAVERALIDLRNADDWTPLLDGTRRSDFAGPSRQPVLPAGGVLDLDVVTAELQSERRPGWSGPNAPRWRLVAWGPLSGVAPEGMIESLQYLAVWLADDPLENDDDPQADSNGVVIVRGESRGPGGSRRVVEATVNRVRPAAVRVTAWREVR